MIFARTARPESFSSLAAVLLLLGSGVCRAESQDQKPVRGELKIEGKYIERLVLGRNDGHTEVLNDPEDTLRLPVGQYLLQDVRLKGGYSRRTMPHAHRIAVSEDEPAVLKVGGPLKQTISVQRQGRILEMTYGLVGVGGETYAAVRNANKRPAFTIYKGDRKISSGKFEFG